MQDMLLISSVNVCVHASILGILSKCKDGLSGACQRKNKECGHKLWKMIAQYYCTPAALRAIRAACLTPGH